MRIRHLWPVVTLSVLFVTLCAVTGLAQSQYRHSIFPQLAVGEGWSADIFVTNQDSATAAVRVALFSNPGTPLVVSSNRGSGSVFNFDVAPGATEAVRVTFPGATTPGYALLRTPSGVSIRSSLVVRWMNNEVVMTQLGVTSQTPFTHFSFPAEVNPAKQTNTGVALALPVIDGLPFESQEFVVALINEDGSLRDLKAVQLAPGEHLAKFINEEPFFTDVPSFSGSVSVFCKESFGLLALRLEQGALGSLTISSGPVIGPYLVSGGSSETEPNDSRTNANALTLPARVTGVIGNSSDQDYFSFSGRRGDILTALTDIRGLGSDADTVLVLMDSAGNVLCSNDQNGFNNNSFLQRALPADGTYYLQVTEWTERGGSTFTYSLHVTLNGDGTPPVVPAPVISSVTPNNATAGTTTTITIAGTNLAGASAVIFDPAQGVSIGSINSTATQVTASVTVSSAATTGSRTIAVQTAGGTSNTLPFQINPPAVQNAPTMTSLSPTSVTQGNTTGLTIFGTNLNGEVTVIITPPDGITVTDPFAMGTLVSATLQVSPTATIGARQVSVTTANGTSNTLTLTVEASVPSTVPVITSVTPNNANLGVSTDITITGTNLSGANSVDFTPYVSATYSQINANATQMTATLYFFPSATPGTYSISVHTPGGTSNGLPFTVNTPPPPTITALSPANATQGVKYRLNIVGTNMDWDTTLTITPSTGLTISNKSSFDKHLAADLDVSASAPLGARQVTVTSKGGTSNTLTMTIVGPGSGGTAPTISNVTVGTVTWNGSTATVPVSFDFSDPDADIIYTPNNAAASAAVVFSVTCSTNRFSGTTINKPGITSGTFHLNVQVENASHGTSTVSLQLIDAGGHYSNTLTFQTTGWRGCELKLPSSLELKQDDAGGWREFGGSLMLPRSDLRTSYSPANAERVAYRATQPLQGWILPAVNPGFPAHNAGNPGLCYATPSALKTVNKPPVERAFQPHSTPSRRGC